MTYGGQGRPSKLDDLTDVQIEEAMQAIAIGVPYRFAAVALDVTEATMRNWIRRGEEDRDAGVSSSFADFFSRVEAAKAKHVIDAHQAMYNCERGHKGHEWVLSRRHPELFHQGTKLEHSGQLDGHQTVTVFPADVLDQLDDVDDIDDIEG